VRWPSRVRALAGVTPNRARQVGQVGLAREPGGLGDLGQRLAALEDAGDARGAAKLAANP